MKIPRITLPDGRRIRVPSKPLATRRPNAVAARGRLQQPIAPNQAGSDTAAQLTPATAPILQPSATLAFDSNDIKRWWLDEQGLQQLTASLGEITYLAQECRKVQKALETTGQLWIHESLAFSRLVPTEFERAQRRLIAACDMAQRQLNRVRLNNISSTAINEEDFVRRIGSSCRQCRKVNLENKAAGRPFECLVDKWLNQPSQPGFRYHLNEQGDINESL